MEISPSTVALGVVLILGVVSFAGIVALILLNYPRKEEEVIATPFAGVGGDVRYMSPYFLRKELHLLTAVLTTDLKEVNAYLDEINDAVLFDDSSEGEMRYVYLPGYAPVYLSTRAAGVMSEVLKGYLQEVKECLAEGLEKGIPFDRTYQTIPLVRHRIAIFPDTIAKWNRAAEAHVELYGDPQYGREAI